MYDQVELVGLYTDICVISNVMLFKADMPNTPIFVELLVVQRQWIYKKSFLKMNRKAKIIIHTALSIYARGDFAHDNWWEKQL